MEDLKQMRSLTGHTYAQRDLSQGDLFEAEPSHVPILVGLGRAIEEDEVMTTKRPTYGRRDMNADLPATRSAAGKKPVPMKPSRGKKPKPAGKRRRAS